MNILPKAEDFIREEINKARIEERGKININEYD